MPLRDYKCTNVDCDLLQERFVNRLDEFPVCAKCGSPTFLMERSQEGERRRTSSVFPFTTTHIDPKGRPMTIESMGHLRRVEQEYGVALSVFSNEHNNSMDHLKDPPVYKGWDREHRGQ